MSTTMPLAWLHEMSKQQLEELASQLGLKVDRMLDDLRRYVKEKWSVIKPFLPSPSMTAKFTPGTKPEFQATDSLMMEGSYVSKMKLKLLADMVKNVPFLADTDPERVLKFSIAAKEVHDLKLIADSELIALLVSRFTGRMTSIFGSHLNHTQNLGMVQEEIVNTFLPTKVKERYLTLYILDHFPTVKHAFANFHNVKVFSVLDLNSAYYQIPLAANSPWATAFCMAFGFFKFNKLPMGISVGCQVLIRVVDRLFGDLKQKFVCNFMDDLVVYSRSLPEHLEHLAEVFRRLQEAGFTLKPDKLPLARTKNSFLGYLVSGQRVKVLPEPVEVIRNFPAPKNLKGVQKFLGITRFYGQFVDSFSGIAEPLHMPYCYTIPTLHTKTINKFQISSLFCILQGKSWNACWIQKSYILK
jgi:hypothetical protein